jgi:DHA1 family inner membrane transport protein
MLACNRLQNEMPRSRLVAALAALGACAACFVTAESLPIGLLPQIAASMHASLALTGLLVTIYALIVVAVTVPLSNALRAVRRRTVLAATAGTLAVGCLGCVLAPDYGLLLAARALAACAQAVFWAVGPVQAAGLVRPERRGQAVTAVFAGSAAGLVIGLPVGTAIGHLAGWRAAFVVLGAVALVLLLLLLLALPVNPPTAAVVSRERPAGRSRYRSVLAATCLAVSAYFAAYTYANPLLVRVAGLPRASVAPVLLVVGLASTLGLGFGGLLYGRRPRHAGALSVSLMALALLGLFATGVQPLLAIACLALLGLGQSLMTVANQLAVMEHGPANGTAWYSTAYNIGIASGPLLGALALTAGGLRDTALAGALVAFAALAVLALAPGRLSGTPGSP